MPRETKVSELVEVAILYHETNLHHMAAAAARDAVELAAKRGMEADCVTSSGFPLRRWAVNEERFANRLWAQFRPAHLPWDDIRIVQPEHN
jgi:hypothetical protein